jgi:putative nucleotidyltransferase with HDIG domain
MFSLKATRELEYINGEKENGMGSERTILIVHDERRTRDRIRNFLTAKRVPVDEAETLTEAAALLRAGNGYAMALVRGGSGKPASTDALRKIRSIRPNLPLLLLIDGTNPNASAALLQHGVADQVTALDNLAGIYSAVHNEFQKSELRNQSALYLNKLKSDKLKREGRSPRASELEEIHDSTLENLMAALDLRDVETYGHSRTVAKYSQVLAGILGIADEAYLENIRKGALLHDIGKIAIPDAILKKPLPLTNSEWEKIKLHPSLGFGLISEIKLEKTIGDIILHHHERYDGSGYPAGLAKEDIPSEARIFALADALDAITSHRPYSQPRGFAEARREIRARSGTQFDPEVVEAFCSYPPERWSRIRFESTRLLPRFEDFKRVILS